MSNSENVSRLFSVVTTIQEPTQAIRQLNATLSGFQGKLLVIGDQKGPALFDLEGVEFLSLKEQLALDLKLAHKLPTGHYTRKNIGYLLAITEGASCIYETDDDNAPLPNWAPRHEAVTATTVVEKRWLNVYQLFSKHKIWPRGFPLDEVQKSFQDRLSLAEESINRIAPIQQGLANNSPDVDAIWRLILDEPFDFQPGPSVHLPRGSWCPFNSQSTWWFPAAYPLMYLPSYCSFRMTDIWRSFIAQRCLWELGFGLVFHSPEVIQERNAHNLMRDFADEIPGYMRNNDLVNVLEHLSLTSGIEAVGDNVMSCYEALVGAELFPPTELELVAAWLDDICTINTTQRQGTDNGVELKW